LTHTIAEAEHGVQPEHRPAGHRGTIPRGERVLWETALSLAHDDASRWAALEFATHLPRSFEVATTHAAEVYLEAEEPRVATGERIPRDLLEDLIAARMRPAG
jgi:hypothetical protein